MIDREQELRNKLADLHRRYLEEAEPYLSELVEIEACKPIRQFFIDTSFLSSDASNEVQRKIFESFAIPREIMGSEP